LCLQQKYLVEVRSSFNWNCFKLAKQLHTF